MEHWHIWYGWKLEITTNLAIPALFVYTDIDTTRHPHVKSVTIIMKLPVTEKKGVKWVSKNSVPVIDNDVSMSIKYESHHNFTIYYK